MRYSDYVGCSVVYFSCEITRFQSLTVEIDLDDLNKLIQSHIDRSRKCYISLLHVILCERRDVVSKRGNDAFLRIDLTSDTRHIIVNEILWRASVNTKSLIIEFISTFGTISSHKRTCGTFTGARITVDQILCQETSIRASIIATVLEVVNMR